MNKLIYTLMDKKSEPRIIDEEYLESLYEYYRHCLYICDRKLDIYKDQFKEIITVIYDVLRLKTTEEEFRNAIIKSYINLLIADSRDNYNVDCKWFIDHVWYLKVGVSSTECDTEKYSDCIPFIQETLMKKFNIQEKLSDKVKRKIFTGYMSR